MVFRAEGLILEGLGNHAAENMAFLASAETKDLEGNLGLHWFLVGLLDQR